MRYYSFMALAAAMLVGSTSFANDSIEFECKLDASKTKGGRCFVRGELCFDEHGNRNECGGDSHDRNEESRIDAELRVRCTDGFELFDRRADVDFRRDDLIIRGRDNGDEAKLLIEDVKDNHDRNREFDATLRTENNVDATYVGECRFERDNHDM